MRVTQRPRGVLVKKPFCSRYGSSNILQSHRLLVYSRCQRFQPDRAAVIKLDYAAQHPPVERVKAELVDLELGERCIQRPCL